MELRNLERKVFGSSFTKQQAGDWIYILYLSCFISGETNAVAAEKMPSNGAVDSMVQCL